MYSAQVEEDALEAELDNDLLDEEEEEDDEVQIKQEKGRKLRSRRKKKRKLTFIPRKLNRIYQCDQCPAMFARDTQLKYHAKVHVDQTEVRHGMADYFMVLIIKRGKNKFIRGVIEREKVRCSGGVFCGL